MRARFHDIPSTNRPAADPDPFDAAHAYEVAKEGGHAFGPEIGTIHQLPNSHPARYVRFSSASESGTFMTFMFAPS